MERLPPTDAQDKLADLHPAYGEIDEMILSAMRGVMDGKRKQEDILKGALALGKLMEADGMSREQLQALRMICNTCEARLAAVDRMGETLRRSFAAEKSAAIN